MSDKPLVDWFGNPLPMPKVNEMRVNPCIALYGAGEAGKKCGECALLVGIAKAKTYYKCRQRKNSNGAATDHRRNWPACGKFEQRTESIPLYDGRS